MEQVPSKYAIIGAGSLAKHLSHYFSLLGIPYTSISSRSPSFFPHSHALIAISDDAIIPFIESHKNLLQGKTLIHFSGALFTTLAHCVHPLYTFSQDPYSLDIYKSIPLISDSLQHLFPELPNPRHYLSPHLKPKYHALCVLSNNFTTLLWQKFFDELPSLNLPPTAIQPFLHQTLQNLLHNPQSALTGPLPRNDQSTINANLQALQGDPFQKIYQTFLDTYHERTKTIS